MTMLSSILQLHIIPSTTVGIRGTTLAASYRDNRIVVVVTAAVTQRARTMQRVYAPCNSNV